MMNKLKAKLKKQGGFTLVEMLIVVAIIAILVAVSIPLVGSALEQARKATDASNERSFKAALVSEYLLNQAGMANGDLKIEADKPYAYDAVNGKVVADIPTSGAKYGKSGDASVGPKDMTLVGSINTKGEVFMTWAVALGTDPITVNGTNLVSPELVSGT